MNTPSIGLTSDELWTHADGGTLSIHIIEPSGRYTLHELGKHAKAGETPFLHIPANCWFAAEPATPGRRRRQPDCAGHRRRTQQSAADVGPQCRPDLSPHRRSPRRRHSARWARQSGNRAKRTGWQTELLMSSVTAVVRHKPSGHCQQHRQAGRSHEGNGSTTPRHRSVRF